LPELGFIGCRWGLLAVELVLKAEPPFELPLALLVAVLETPAAPPPLLLPGEELLVFFGPGLVAFGVLLAGLSEVVVGTPPPPQALSRKAPASRTTTESLGLSAGIRWSLARTSRLGAGLTASSPGLHGGSHNKNRW
jgi:hypothetical protein